MTTDDKRQAEPPAEFSVLYEKLRTAELEATVKAVKAMRRDVTASEEIARLGSDSWPFFTTYLSG